MNCKHEQIRCTNNVFFCLKCGAELPRDFKVEKDTPKAAKPSEGAKKPVKRTTKKKGE